MLRKILILIVLLISAVAINAADFKEPVLITSAGQSSDVLMAKILAGKAKLDFNFQKVAAYTAIDSVESVIIVTGGSIKGMGAAGINKEQEYERVEQLLKKAQKNKKPVICLHVGGKSRRGQLSDYFNKLVAENSDMLVIVKEGNQDQFFSKIAQDKKISIELVDKIISIQDVLSKVFKK